MAYLLNYNQVRIWLIQNYFKDIPLYTMSFELNIEGELNLDLFEKSVQFLMLKNVVLKSNIILQNNVPTLKINNHSFQLKIYNNVDIEERMKKIKNQVFDLENDLLFNISYLNNQDSQKLLLCFSDIIIDGKSIYTFMDDLKCIYNNFINNVIPKITTSNYYTNLNHSNGINSINNIYKIGCYNNTFPIQREIYSNSENRIIYIFPNTYYLKIKEYIKKCKITLFQFLQSIIFILIHKYTNHNSLLIDTVMDTGVSKTIGLYNNTVIIPCNNFNKNDTIQAFFDKNKCTSRILLDNRKILLEKLCSELNFSELPIIRLHFEFKYKNTSFDFDKCSMYSDFVENTADTIRQLLIFNFAELGDVLESYISYKKDCFSENAVKEIRSNMFIIIDKIIHKSDISLKELLDSMEIKTEFNHIYKPKVDYRLLAYKNAGKYPNINYQNFKEKLDTLFSNRD